MEKRITNKEKMLILLALILIGILINTVSPISFDEPKNVNNNKVQTEEKGTTAYQT